MDAAPILAAVENAGYRLTGPRRALADLIAGQGGATFTTAGLVRAARARGQTVGRATVFRAVDLFIEVGAVERIDLPSGEHAYVACVPTHHHHVICSRCGQAADIGDLGLGRGRPRGGPAHPISR